MRYASNPASAMFPCKQCAVLLGHHQQVDRTRAVNSEAGDVPEKYYVVENNDMVRVKYLLVYSKAPVKSTAQ